uniref:acetyl-CoA C-acyltransferase n=2 Tax=Compsopogon caeruleus TaxID=31354 RepID=A0A7S1TEJ8_9RHOD
MVIEAALENVKVKQDLFESLASCTSPHCILATNTSTINIDLIAGKVPDAHQAGRIIGVHFFSPAHKMPLLEIIRTTSTSARTIRTTLAFAKKIRKIPVIVGNCAGFAVNRVYFPQSQVATLLVDRLGLHPYQIDDACENFGLPMGPFRLMDMVGLDIGHAVGQVFGMAFPERVYPSNLVQSLLEAGHKGQKTGQGFYRYIEGSRAPIRDSSVLDKFLPPNLQGGQGNTKFLNSDIIEMTLLPCYNEASRIFHEGIVEKTSDIDIATIFGMAFPEYYGGLVYWGDSFCGGPARVCQRLQHFYELSGHHPIFKPSFALTRAAQQSCLLRNLRKPHRDTGGKDDIVVVSALRTAVGRAGRGGFKNTAAEDILAPVLEATLKQTGICPREVDDIVVGTVLGRGDSSVVQLRVANFLVGGLETNPVKTVNRLCSSGLQAIADAANAIAMGNYDIAVAGGMESMSENAFSNNTLKMNPKAKGNVGACNSYLSMGETSENVAAAFNISRLEQDILAVASHSRAGVAMLAGRQRNEIVPVVTKVLVKNKETGEQYEKQVVVNRDEGIRLGVSVQSLGRLKPVFRENGSTTAGNASQVSDGAALVTLMKREEARRRGLRPLGTLRSFAVAGVDPRVMGIGPVYAIPKALQKAGLTVDDMDLIELNEAFGSQATYCIETLRLNRDIVNVNGGAIAIGHPLGMTGARCTVSILHELARRGGRYGLVSMCVGTGMGAAAVYEVNEDSPAPKL